MVGDWSGSSKNDMVANVNNGDGEDSSLNDDVNYKLRYRTLKRKLKFLIYENESFQEALRSTQQCLLKTCKDRSFLLDRLLQYEKADPSSSDSDDTSSDDQEPIIKPEPQKKKKTDSTSAHAVTPATSSASKPPSAKKRKPTVPKVTLKHSLQHELPNTSPMLADGHMTPEEVERHLESRQSYLEMVPERAPPTVPTEMFSNEPSLDSFCYSESNEVGEVETSPSNLGEDCLSVDLPE